MMSSVNDQVSILYKKFSSWRMVGAELAWEAADRGVIDSVDGHTNRYAALANAVYRGAAKDSPTLRAALGMAAVTTAPVPVCEDCGHVHERLHTCEEDRQRNKRTAANGYFRRAVWIHEDDMPLFDALLARHGVRNLQELIDNHMIHRRRLDDDRAD